MVYQLRGRSRTHTLPYRSRGKLFRGRGRDGNKGQGLLITLNSRNESRDSWNDRPIPDKQDMSRRDDTSYDDSRVCGPSFEKRRKRDDDFDERRGESSSSTRNRSLDKIDLSVDSESLRITFGNERFHRERVEASPKRSALLSERLGPPVDTGSRYQDKDIYADDGAYDRNKRENSWYNRQERERTEKYIEKRDQHDYRQYDRAGRKSPEHHDWKNSSTYNRNSSNSDHKTRDDCRYDKREGRHRDENLRSSRERYIREDVRNKDRKHDRYEEAERDRQHRRDFSHEFSGREKPSRNYVKSRHDSNDSYEREKYQDNFEMVSDRKKRESIERIHERFDVKSESSKYSPEHYKKSPRPESEIFIRDLEQKLHHPAERSLFSPGLNEMLDSAVASHISAKPLKSILKKKSEPFVEQHDQGNHSSFDSQVTDFLKSLQSPISRSTDLPDNIASNSSFETTQEMKGGNSHYVQGRKLDITAIGQSEMDVDDEEEFLYGQKNRVSQQSHQDALFPVVESNQPRSGSRPTQSLLSEEAEKDLSIQSVSSANLPSWMRPLSKHDESGTEKKEDDMDKTVQNILKSIGFNFDLSKRMQELAKLKKQKEEEAQFSINKNASFLGAGISSADIKAKLFSKESRTTGEDGIDQEVKEGRKLSSKEATTIETRGKHFTTDHTSSGQWLDMSSRDVKVSDDSNDVVCSTSTASKYTNQHNPLGAQVSQEKSTVPQFHAQPTPYPSYTEAYQPAFSHALAKEHLHMMPPATQHFHVPLPYNYSLPYPHPGFAHAVPHDVMPHHTLPHPAQHPPKAKRASGSSNLTVIPLSIDDKKVEKKVEKNNHPKKRERDKSPEYSRIVIAPKSKDKQNISHVKKVLKQQKEDKEKKVKTAASKEMKEIAVKKTRTEHSSAKQEPQLTQVSAQEQQSLLKESEERKKKLLLLEKELGKLKKHQNEIMRRRQRQRDGHKDPLLVQNSKLQEEITAQIKMLRKASEKSYTLLCEDVDKKHKTPVSTATDEPVKDEIKGNCKKEIPDKSTSGSSVERHEFYDPGNHWCGVCNHVSASLLDHLTHLQSRKHKQKCDPYDRPWLSETLDGKKLDKADSVEITAMKGVEFLMSTDAFYCTLCRVFTGDVSSAEAHIKSEEHFIKYKSHIKQNEFYEKRYILEKTAALSHVKETGEQRKGSEVRETTARAKKLSEGQEVAEEKILDKDTCKAKNLIEKRKEKSEILCVELHADHEIDQLKEDVELEKKVVCFQENRNSKDTNKPVDGSEGSKNRDSQIFNSSKRQKVERDEEMKEDLKQEEATKGKIAIKLTGKTGIKPQSKVLPPWTPVTKKLETAKIKTKTEIISLKKGISKPESHPPTSLDTFLTIGGPTTKRLPVYKLRSGTVKKPLNKRVISPEKKRSDGKDSAELEDMKLLGIEDISLQIAPKKVPPPRSQNLSLPKELCSQSSSSAQELYTVFFQDFSEEKCTYDINLDDIPIPPPPPQPPVPNMEISEISLPSDNTNCVSSGSSQSPDTAVICKTSLIEEAMTVKEQESNFYKEDILNVNDVVEDSVKESVPSIVDSGTNDADEKSRELVDEKNDTCFVEVEAFTAVEGSKVQRDGTNDTKEKSEKRTAKKEDTCFEEVEAFTSCDEGSNVQSDGTNDTEEKSEKLTDKEDTCFEAVKAFTSCGEVSKVRSDGTNDTEEKNEKLTDKKEDTCFEEVEDFTTGAEGSKVQSDGTNDTEEKSEKHTDKKEDTCFEEMEDFTSCGEGSNVQSHGTNDTEEKNEKHTDKKEGTCFGEVEDFISFGEGSSVQSHGTNDTKEKSEKVIDKKEDTCFEEVEAFTCGEGSKVQNDTTETYTAALNMENSSDDVVKEISQKNMSVDLPGNKQIIMTHAGERQDTGLHVDYTNRTDSQNVRSEGEKICESNDSKDFSIAVSVLSGKSLSDSPNVENLSLPYKVEDIPCNLTEETGDNEVCMFASDAKCSDVLGEKKKPNLTVTSPATEGSGEYTNEDDADDCASVCSGSSVLMGSDFEVVDEYEAD